MSGDWRDVSEAPRDGRWVEGEYHEGGERFVVRVRWSDSRACMLGSRAGHFGCGWESEDRLPMDEPDFWRET